MPCPSCRKACAAGLLIRADSGGGTHDFLAWLRRPGRLLQYSVGMAITDDIAGAILDIPARAWTPAYDADRQVRPGAWVAEITGMLNLPAWPSGMRVIVRKERPHPGAQLRFTDIGGHRFTCFATSTKKGQLADLELRHRRRARCEDRILLWGSRPERTGRPDGSSRSAIDQKLVVTPQVLHEATCPATAGVRAAATTSTTPTKT